MRWKFNELGMTGLRLSGACAWHFWAGWTAWCISGFAFLYAEYNLRSPGEYSAYGFEAALALLTPVLALMLADHVALASYQRVWFDLQRPGCALNVLDLAVVDRIREDLRFNLLLRWFMPPASKHLSAQLMSVCLWYPAVATGPAHGFWARYGEWVIDVLCGYLLLVAAALAGMLWLGGGGVDVPWLQHTIMLAAAIALGVLGYSTIRFSSRRQAVLDYFSNWRIESETQA